MFRRLPVAVAILGLAWVSLHARADETFGKGVTLPEATAIQALYARPDTFVGKTIRVDGVVDAVC